MLVFHVNCLLDNFYEISKPIFLEKRKIIIGLSSAEVAKRMVKVNA